jgi:hypothetical protein
MKQVKLIAAIAVMTLTFVSCNKVSYKSFVGTWGVEKIEYYNIDYAGNPIPATIETYTYDPNDIKNGIQLVFKDDKTGEMRDNTIDTVGVNWNDETQDFESYVYNPDTTIVSTFTCSFDKDESVLSMTVKYTYPYVYTRTFMMKVSDLTDNSFSYENEYRNDYVEHAYLKRISDDTSKSANRSKPVRPRKLGSFLSNR